MFLTILSKIGGSKGKFTDLIIIYYLSWGINCHKHSCFILVIDIIVRGIRWFFERNKCLCPRGKTWFTLTSPPPYVIAP